MAEYSRPLPVPDGDTKPYWDAAREHRLVIQRCQDCHESIFYPRSVCPQCMSDRIDWIEASGKGTIYSFTVVHRAPAQFADSAPYVVALVDLAEGVRLMTNIVCCDPTAVRIGAAVEVEFDEVTPEIALPKFHLAAGNGS
jgi:uncharacterized OB-fold protein